MEICADKNPQQHVPLQEYSENLKEITRLLASSGVSSDRVIFITPPPIHEPSWEKECILKGSTFCHCFPSCIIAHTMLYSRRTKLKSGCSCLFQDALLTVTTLSRGSMPRRVCRLLLSVAQTSWTSGLSCRKTGRWAAHC